MTSSAAFYHPLFSLFTVLLVASLTVLETPISPPATPLGLSLVVVPYFFFVWCSASFAKSSAVNNATERLGCAPINDLRTYLYLTDLHYTTLTLHTHHV